MKKPLTPMMAQYRRLHKALPEGVLLMFRLGDFYEMFFEDARVAARILEVTLTRRNGMPMCGVPYHAVEGYLAKLIRAGRKVALCDQVEEASQAKGIVRREVTRIVTPGTVLEEQVLEAGRNNYLAGLLPGSKAPGLALLELSTGEFQIMDDLSWDRLRSLLLRHAPAECVLPDAFRDDGPAAAWRAALPAGSLLSFHEEWAFDEENARDFLCRHFQVHSLDGFGLPAGHPGLGAAGGMLHYVISELKRPATHVRRLTLAGERDEMILDETTAANLELTVSRSGETAYATTLLEVLDVTCGAMGARLLRRWLTRPLTDPPAIHARQEGVAALLAQGGLRQQLRATLREVRDLERLIARLHAGGGNARDLAALAASLDLIPAIHDRLRLADRESLAALAARLDPLPALAATLRTALAAEPPVSLREGGLLRDGYHAELDALRSAGREGRQWMAAFQREEEQRTGIKSLKVRYNRVFGYYIEVTKANLPLVPESYIRKQTLVNAERFITPALKEVEQRILGAQERAAALEYDLFLDLRAAAVQETAAIQKTAAALAELDVLAALADRAGALQYTRPTVNDGDRIRIVDGRHPVVEQIPDAERFVPNDSDLDGRDQRLLILTGPNMAGKSTYIRQVALIVIMAHMGSFVPAREAEIGVVDRVFTRVGAGDDLARGRSTFMVEMQETANILHNATPRSLVVLDEIGRGTSTFDGISIAWAVAECLHNEARLRPKTLFATHYHELTDLARVLPGARNYSVLIREHGDRIAFLRKVVPGPADKSYGIHVARLAGLPAAVIERAQEILANLEDDEFNPQGQPKVARRRPRSHRKTAGQLSLFEERGEA